MYYLDASEVEPKQYTNTPNRVVVEIFNLQITYSPNLEK